MKPSSIKTIVVSLNEDVVFEIDIDYDIFDDPFMEAATQAVEKIKERKYGMIRPIAQIWEKDNMKKTTICYNSYWILVNAGCYKKAEILREKFKMQHRHDLAKEPYHANFVTKPS